MNFYFQNLSAGIILFYLVASAAISATAHLVFKMIAKYVFKGKFRLRNSFMILTIILFAVFMLLVLAQKPYEGDR